MKACIEKVNWDKIRNEVNLVNPELCSIIDAINPDAKHSLYKARYPYGYESVKKGQFCWPDKNGNPFPLINSNIGNCIKEDLLYNLGSNPFTLVLKNALEIFIDMGRHTIPFAVIPSGYVVSNGVMLDNRQDHSQPAFLWNVSSGARSLFMLRKISVASKYKRLSEIINAKIDYPKKISDHGKVFQALGRNCDWALEVMYFGKKWGDHLNDQNAKWVRYNNYLYRQAWSGACFWRVEFIWNFIFSVIKKNSNLKPDPYLADTVKHLLAISIGVFPGFAPALDDALAPINYFQKIFTDVYGLDNYAPIIMQPNYFSMYKASNPVYYFLQYPTTFCFSPKSSKFAKNIRDLEDIRLILKKYLQEIDSEKLNLKGTAIAEIPKLIKYDFFHSTGKAALGIKSSDEMIATDQSFTKIIKKFNGKKFPTASKSFMGIISINKNK